MIDILLLAGAALCVLSVLMAIVSVARTRAPRGAALLLVLGIALLFAGTALDPRPPGLNTLAESWHRLANGPASAPAPESAAPEDAAPEAGVPATAGPAAAEAPAAEPAGTAAPAPAAEAGAAAPTGQ